MIKLYLHRMKSMRFAMVFTLAAVCLLSPGVGSAANNPPATLEPGALFRDHMILQRELELPVWGWSAPGATITVEFAAQKQQTKAGQDGKWLVKLKPLKTSAVPAQYAFSGKPSVNLFNGANQPAYPFTHEVESR